MRRIARALDRSQLPLQLAIIAGRNETLYKQLRKLAWHVPSNIQGFVTNMPDWMRASDLVITKAGPGTIMETLAAGKPMLLSGYLRGQEEGNVKFVQEEGVGILCLNQKSIVRHLRAWMDGQHQQLDAMQARARRAARPNAALEIVQAIETVIDKPRAV